MGKKLKWIDWLKAFGYKRLAEVLDVNEKTTYNWLMKGALPKDSLKRVIVRISGGVLDFNSFYEV